MQRQDKPLIAEYHRGIPVIDAAHFELRKDHRDFRAFIGQFLKQPHKIAPTPKPITFLLLHWRIMAKVFHQSTDLELCRNRFTRETAKQDAREDHRSEGEAA